MNAMASTAAQRASEAPPIALADGEAESHADPSGRASEWPRASSRWMGWRLRALAALALLACVGLLLLARALAEPMHIDARWRVNSQGQVELAQAADAGLAPLVGRVLEGVGDGSGPVVAIDALALQSSARWLVGDADRSRHRALHAELAAVFDGERVALSFAGATRVEVSPHVRGYARLPLQFWLLGLLALVLWLAGVAVLLARPSSRNLLYALMSTSQSANLLFIAAQTPHELALPGWLVQWDLPARTAFDLITAAAVVHAATLHPRRLPQGGAIAAAGWAGAAACAAVALSGAPRAWWWTQLGVLGLALVASWLFAWSYRHEPHPFAAMLRRFAVVATGAFALLTVAIAAVPSATHAVATLGPLAWSVFFACLLLGVPYLSRSQQVMREFALLAAISAIATALDLLFVTLFSIGPFPSLALSLFFSLAVYAGARQWIVERMLGASLLTTERVFERLYRIAREVQARPACVSERMSELLRELFEALEVTGVAKHASRARRVDDGATLLVPLPAFDPDGEAEPRSIAVRYAQRGRRLFTSADERLADRVVEQLQRAIAFDRAVEQGRSEERLRLAQDLHDDIGARLLTLMYKAPSPEVEDYVRHTLQDLKTLTRGLATASHPLSHAAAEWKTDLAQRLSVAQCELRWSASFDEDLTLSVVQWSALTRVLRELASNVIAHAKATEVRIALRLAQDQLELSVADDGCGRNPEQWSQGLGLGGVRKRVRQLGGDVRWFEVAPRGIGCRVCVEQFSRPR